MKILEPKLIVDDIQFDVDATTDLYTKNLLESVGNSFPLLKINNYLVPVDTINYMRVDVGPGGNLLPTFIFYIDDSNYNIRRALQNQIDTCTIFIGWTSFYTKFNGIVTSVFSTTGDSEISVSGYLYQEPLHNSKQQIWKDTSIIDILKSICTDTSLGLFINDTDTLNYQVPLCINPNMRSIDFIQWLLREYTDTIYCLDTFGYLHIGTIESILKKEIDKYTISGIYGKQIEPTNIRFVAGNKRYGEFTDNETLEIRERENINVSRLTITNNFSETLLYCGSEYSVVDDTSAKNIINTNSLIGNGKIIDNTFNGFVKHKFPRNNQRINKQKNGNLIEFELNHLMIELVPFTVVELEIYHDTIPKENTAVYDNKTYLDTEHSGKHFVLDYSFIYDKSSARRITQHVRLI